MSSAKNYQRYCSKCAEDTTHVSAGSGIAKLAVKTGKIIVFLVSCGMLCPHVFSEDEEILATCEKCGTQVAISTQ